MTCCTGNVKVKGDVYILLAAWRATKVSSPLIIEKIALSERDAIDGEGGSLSGMVQQRPGDPVDLGHLKAMLPQHVHAV